MNVKKEIPKEFGRIKSGETTVEQARRKLNGDGKTKREGQIENAAKRQGWFVSAASPARNTWLLHPSFSPISSCVVLCSGEYLRKSVCLKPFTTVVCFLPS